MPDYLLSFVGEFLLVVYFAITINKSQDQFLSNVGLYLSRPVFTHGQLYVVVSIVWSKSGLNILILDKDRNPSTLCTKKYSTTYLRLLSIQLLSI